MKNFAIFAAAFSVLPAFSGFAQSVPCGGIVSDLDRLACYDRESGKAPTPEISSGKGDWVTQVEKSQFKDTTDVYLMSVSEEPLPCSKYTAHQPARLILQCVENKTELIISTECHLASGHNGYGDVDIRIGSNASFVSSMVNSTDNKALGLTPGSSSIPVIKRMIGEDVALVRFTPFGQSAVTTEFKLSGLNEAIKPLRESCGW